MSTKASVSKFIEDRQHRITQRLANEASLGALPDELLTALTASDYVLDLFLKDRFSSSWVEAVLSDDWSIDQELESLELAITLIDDESEFNRRLRVARQQVQSALIIRDLSRLNSTESTCRCISAAADYFIQIARDWHYQQLVKRHGLPDAKGGPPLELQILAMGKLGGQELNLSSDIDLIFCYRHGGYTTGDKAIDHQTFFTRVGQGIIRSLDQRTADGFVYRVDMRLRPYGSSGALVSSFDAFEQYLATQARSWERYALAKARVIKASLDQSDAHELNSIIQPFSFRRYIDYSVIDSLREIKSLIKSENARLNRRHNVKLGPGGIREVEFIVQSFQVTLGGRFIELRNPSVFAALPLLSKHGCLAEQDIATLRAAYEFLRNCEHAIQAWRDEQSQTLPSDEETFAYLAWVMGFEEIETFLETLDGHRERCAQLFTDTIKEEATVKESRFQLDSRWHQLWQNELAGVDLNFFGFLDIQAVVEQIHELQSSRAFEQLQTESRKRVDEFAPRLLAACASTEKPNKTLGRCWPILNSILRRSTYMVMLLEHPQALGELVKLAAASPWISDQFARHPALLHELLNASQLYTPPSREQLQSEIRQQLMRLNWDDLEGHMEVLRYFKQSHVLRVAACEVTDRLPLMKVSDYLTFLAEVILEQVLAIAWTQMTERHGAPTHNGDALLSGDRFCVLAYGKLGGWELGHSSDLDIVFIHDTDPLAQSNGAKPLDNQTFFARLGQRMIHIMATEMPSGRLYEIDTRLRPSGNSGPLVSSLTAFTKYQQKSAWVWEHQALVRARVVAGDGELARRINEVRSNVLSMPRDEAELRSEVLAMRQKMMSHLGNQKTDKFHLKQDKGGMVDIEFMVQFLVLAKAQSNQSLLKWTDNIRLLEAFVDVGLFSSDQCKRLTEAYKAYRSAGHRLALQQKGNWVDPEKWRAPRQDVIELWSRYLSENE